MHVLRKHQRLQLEFGPAEKFFAHARRSLQDFSVGPFLSQSDKAYEGSYDNNEIVVATLFE